MKIVDRLLVKSFIPPFIVTFMIAMFVLVMQVLWLYIDDIAGKGLGLFLILELMGYKSLSLVPMALPLAVLISSVMVMGNMAEKYELSSFKSAGVSLARIMRPIIGFGMITVLASFFCSNNLIPVANLKFGSRMYDIQKQKPALRLEAGIFNDDFDGFAIHIGNKPGDGKRIEDVLIYDHTDANKGKLSQIIASDGEMYATEDGNYFMMNLYDGHQYMEGDPSGSGNSRSYPFVRTNFKSWYKVFDLSEFNLNRTNEELFKSNRSMLTSGQLADAIDSLELKIKRREVGISNQFSSYFDLLELDSTFLDIPDDEDNLVAAEAERIRAEAEKEDSASAAIEPQGAPPVSAKQEEERIEERPRVTEDKKTDRKPIQSFEGRPLKQVIEEPLESYESIVLLFPESERLRLINKSKSFIRSIQAHAESATRSIDRLRESRVKHIYELHTKYSMALVCFIFVFIGAPMGAIVRKGGFGYPILISIIFFMVFIVLTIFCRKIAESFVLPAAVAAWVPCTVLFPVGIILTRKAMNDSKLVDIDQYVNFFKAIFKLFKKRKTAHDPAV
ncbi:MAG: LptF/LptG family permease [Phaeodactylibacter sp.]|uniref:LptF/LptG family permease n=1 Tax=Phaeodactylibacter sp. TaxID=1940289 RepID=UPI0032EFA944